MNPAVWVFIGLTLGALVWLSWKYSLAAASTRWPRVEGKIVSKWVDKADDNEALSYWPRVEYEYKVNGTRYNARTIRLTDVDFSMSEDRAESIVAGYVVGDPVEVWYDPRKPARATLERGGGRLTLALLVAVSVLGPVLAFSFSNEGRRILGEMGIPVY